MSLEQLSPPVDVPNELKIISTDHAGRLSSRERLILCEAAEEIHRHHIEYYKMATNLDEAQKICAAQADRIKDLNAESLRKSVEIINLRTPNPTYGYCMPVQLKQTS